MQNTLSMKIGILGYGEVGQAIAGLYESIVIRDPYKEYDDDMSNLDLLNVCIPYTNGFVDDVKEIIEDIKPKHTVIHSTVPVGTTESVGMKVIHSPVRGLHPNLLKGLKTFVKYIGGGDSMWYKKHLESMSIRVKVVENSKTSELAKLADTTYYGICIAFTSDMKKLCDEYDLDFTEVMTRYNETYNEGYRILGKPNVVRPVLHPTDQIGGHCVISNAKLLPRTKLIDGLLDYE